MFARLGLLLLLSSASVWAQKPVDPSRVVTFNLESKLVQKVLPYRVVLPIDYGTPAAKTFRYPVLYLLHGLTGNYANWTERSKLIEHAAKHRVLIVTPDGSNGWYTDSAQEPAEKYESYILEELIPDVQRRFRTIESREGRAIAGLSMGGYGALKFGIKHPQLFVFAGSMSGALEPTSWSLADMGGNERFYETLRRTFGDLDSKTRKENDLVKLLKEMPDEQIKKLPFLYLDCGTEDRLLVSNRRFADLLLERKIPHEFRLLPGGHSWTYWDQQVVEVLRLAERKLACVQEATSVPAASN